MESVEYLGFLIEVVSPETGTYEYSVFDMAGNDKPEFPIFETDDVEFVSFGMALYDAKSWIRDFLFNDEDRAKEHIEKLYATKKALSSFQCVEITGRASQKLTTDVFNRPDCPAWANYAAVDEDGEATFFEKMPYTATKTCGCFLRDCRYMPIPRRFYSDDWEDSLIERPVLQKLTAEVFNRPDCPEWARYAVVNANGKVVFFSDVPSPRYDKWIVTYSAQTYMLDDVRFDASDWRNSLIERPAKLPDWCKVGEWCYCKDDDGNDKYFKIARCDNHFIYGDDGWDIAIACAKPARLRPYNAEEMHGLVGKVLKHSTGEYLVTAFEIRWNQVKIESAWREANELAELWKQLDDSPCGRLEHLENGEWVE